jgi:hypothetical protein
MALQPQTLPISLGQGVDTKTDPKQVVQGKLLSLENGRFGTTKEITKRIGSTALPQAIFGGSSISKGYGVASYNNELDLVDGSSLYSYSPNEQSWLNKGPLVGAGLSVQSIVRNSGGQSVQDHAFDSATGLHCYVYQDSINGLCYSILDSSTQALIVQGGVIDATGGYAKVLKNGSNFVIIYQEVGATLVLHYKTIATNNPSVISAATTISIHCDENGLFDCEVIGSNIYIAHSYAFVAGVMVYSLSSSLVLSSPFLTQTGAAANGANSIAVFGDASNNVWVAFSNSTDTAAFILNSSLTQQLAPTVIATSGQVPLGSNITGYVSGTTAHIYWTYNTGGTARNAIAQNTLTFGGTAGTPGTFILGLNLASKIFLYNSTPYMFVFNSGPTIQGTYFLLNLLGQIILKLAPGDAGGVPTATCLLPEVISISTGNFIYPYLFKDNLSSNFNGITYLTGLSSAQINLNPLTTPTKAVLGDNLHLGVGQVYMYDGSNVVEHNFHLYPEIVSGVYQSGSGQIGPGSNTANVASYKFSYVACYEWQDNQGQTHRSSPSAKPVTVSLGVQAGSSSTGNFVIGASQITNVGGVTPASAYSVGQIINNANLAQNTYVTAVLGGSNILQLSAPCISTSAANNPFGTFDVDSILVTVPTLTATAKNNVTIELYRTTCNGTVYYKTATAANNPATDSITFTDTTADSLLVSNPQLYTNGGEVENIGAPAANIVYANSKGRVILVPSESPLTWWYSKQVISGVPVEFSDLFTTTVTSKLGSITAIGEMDDKLVFFGPTTKGYVVGSGPAADGTNNDYSDLILIPSTKGCQNQASVISTPDGIIYQSARGIYLLSRNLTDVYIGADVEAYSSYAITSAQATPNTTEIEFTLSNGQKLVYDYNQRQWGVDTLPAEAFDTTIFSGVTNYLTTTGLVTQAAPGTYTDNTAFIPLSLKTSWLQMAGIQGFQRVWDLNILGTYFSPHTLTVNIYTDYQTSPGQTVTIPVLSDPVGYQFTIHLLVQKCEAMQIEIIETQSGSFGQGFSISALTFSAGIKQGLRSLPESKSYG